VCESYIDDVTLATSLNRVPSSLYIPFLIDADFPLMAIPHMHFLVVWRLQMGLSTHAPAPNSDSMAFNQLVDDCNRAFRVRDCCDELVCGTCFDKVCGGSDNITLELGHWAFGKRGARRSCNQTELFVDVPYGFRYPLRHGVAPVILKPYGGQWQMIVIGTGLTVPEAFPGLGSLTGTSSGRWRLVGVSFGRGRSRRFRRVTAGSNAGLDDESSILRKMYLEIGNLTISVFVAVGLAQWRGVDILE
jgi:hypothetical protein